jgi:hypothetical protein
MGSPSLLVTLDYLELLADVKPEKLGPAALRWHGRLELEASVMTLAESQLALVALASLCEESVTRSGSCVCWCGGCSRRSFPASAESLQERRRQPSNA